MPVATANGKKFTFPEGTTPEQMGQAIDEFFGAQGGGAAPNMGDPYTMPPSPTSMDPTAPADPEAPVDPSMGVQTLNAIRNNLDVPLGMVGGAVGAVTPVPGATVGGAALGTAAGSALSDIVGTEGDGTIQWDDVATDTAIGATLDTAMLKAGPLVSRGLKNVGGKLGLTALPETEATKAFAELQETQRFLRERGGSLDLVQAGNEGTFVKFAKEISEAGILSGGEAARKSATNNRILAQELERMMTEASSMRVDDAGMVIYDVINAGSKAAGEIYSAGMDGIIEKVGTKAAGKAQIVSTLESFLEGNTKAFGSELDKDAQNLIKAYLKEWKAADNVTVGDLLAFQKKLNKDINGFSSMGSKMNTSASADLSSLSTQVKEAISSEVEAVSPAALAAFKDVNKAYGQAMGNLMPSSITGLLENGNKKLFAGIANTFHGREPAKIRAFMGSIDEAFAQAEKAGKQLDFASADEVKGVIREHYLRNIFGDPLANEWDATTFAKLASRQSQPRVSEPTKAVLGPAYNDYMRLIRGMRDITSKEEQAFGTLVLRSKEAGAAGGLASPAGQALGGAALTGAVSTASLPLAATSAAVWFGMPVLLGKIVTNPKAVDAALDIAQKRLGSKAAAGYIGAADAIRMGLEEAAAAYLPEEDKQEYRQIWERMYQDVQATFNPEATPQ